MTPHISSKKEDIAKTDLCPGDPLRAKYIAENFLENARLVNSVRNMLAYTGTYKGKEITVFSSGMGIPSMGIYSYELYKFYDVENIIRIGSCGAFEENLKVFDTALVETSYSDSNFAKALNNVDCHTIQADSELNNIIKETAQSLNIDCKPVNVLCGECFDGYVEDLNASLNRLPKELNITAAEMESFALFHNAKVSGKQAACLLTVSDSMVTNEETTAEERQNSFTKMMEIALEVSSQY